MGDFAEESEFLRSFICPKPWKNPTIFTPTPERFRNAESHDHC